MRFIKRSEITPLTYDTAPSTSLSISIFSKLVVTTFLTSKQLSRRTVSIPYDSTSKYFGLAINHMLLLPICC